MTDFQNLPGFRDFYPSDLAVRSYLMRIWREVSRRYGFEEYDGPPLESLELYIEKSGEEIVHQLYNFEDKGGREVALRPEMTPTLARMVGARARGMRKPIRWASIPQLFRYERTQRGRLREHFQWNVDIIGEDDVAADAEVLAVALDALAAFDLGPDDIVARVSDRRVLERLLLHAGVPEDQLPATYAVVDKLSREPEEKIRERLASEVGLGAASIDEVFGVLGQGSFEGLAQTYGGVEGVSEDIDRLARFFECINDMDLGDWVRFDPSIVRGLAYYTGTVFEVFDRKGELRAICGGGRYDNLLAAVSDVDLPAVGFAMGDVVLADLLGERGLLGDEAPGVDYYIVAIGEEQQARVRGIAHDLRSAGYSVLYSLRGAGVGRQFKDADARGARRTIVLGPDEVEAGVAVVKEMATGEEERVPLEELTS